MVTKKDAAIDWTRRIEARFEPRGPAVVLMSKLHANGGMRAVAGFFATERKRTRRPASRRTRAAVGLSGKTFGLFGFTDRVTILN